MSLWFSSTCACRIPCCCRGFFFFGYSHFLTSTLLTKVEMTWTLFTGAGFEIDRDGFAVMTQLSPGGALQILWGGVVSTRYKEMKDTLLQIVKSFRCAKVPEGIKIDMQKEYKDFNTNFREERWWLESVEFCTLRCAAAIISAGAATHIWMHVVKDFRFSSWHPLPVPVGKNHFAWTRMLDFECKSSHVTAGSCETMLDRWRFKCLQHIDHIASWIAVWRGQDIVEERQRLDWSFSQFPAHISSCGAFRQREEERILQLKATMSVCSEGFFVFFVVF